MCIRDRVYIVDPLIKESEKIDLKNLEEGYQHIWEEFPKCTVCKVHGKMKPAEKDILFYCYGYHLLWSRNDKQRTSYRSQKNPINERKRK